MILLLDNYDSFVFNLARYLEELGEEVEVVRNDALGVEGIRRLGPTHMVLSPGPCTPREAGVCVEAVRTLGDVLPTLGVCLGHQCIGEALGGRVVRAPRPVHGKTSRVRHDGRGLFRRLPRPLRVTRYHSLLVSADGLPEDVRVTARTDDGEVMALEHTRRPLWGVQFHPEAVMTEAGHALLANFLALGRGETPAGTEGTETRPELSEA